METPTNSEDSETPSGEPPAPPSEPTEVEWFGVVRGATVEIQCAMCGAELEVTLEEEDIPSTPDDVAEGAVECEACSKSVELAGKRALIPIVVLSGTQVALVDDYNELTDWIVKNAPEVLERYNHERGTDGGAD